MKRLLLTGAALAVLTGCSLFNPEPVATGAPPTKVETATRKGVASFGVAITAAEQTAAVYARKPQCASGGTNGPDGVGCSNKSTITSLKRLGQKAHDAYFAARKAEDAGDAPDVTAVRTAVSAFNAALPPAVTPVAVP